jgi:exopolysaccharide biosynthesis predicted pyruvyltransferase EpsI
MWREALRATLTPALGEQRTVALIDFPNHTNVGDSAIWLAALEWLRDAGVRVVYQCDKKSYRRDELRQALGHRGAILLTGGGNLGDLWETHQQLREKVIADFPDDPIIQLPQSIHFSSPSRLAQAQAILNRHQHLTLFLRDRESLAFAQRHFTATSALCPDMALYLQLARPGPPIQPVVWLRRHDKEAATVEVPQANTEDWVDAPLPRIAALRDWLTRGMGQWTYRRQAAAELRRGCAFLSRGEFVITDRLHAHILCVLMAIPHALIDNSYGKLSAFYHTWTQASPHARLATPEEAIALAERV